MLEELLDGPENAGLWTSLGPFTTVHFLLYICEKRLTQAWPAADCRQSEASEDVSYTMS